MKGIDLIGQSLGYGFDFGQLVHLKPKKAFCVEMTDFLFVSGAYRHLIKESPRGFHVAIRIPRSFMQLVLWKVHALFWLSLI